MKAFKYLTILGSILIFGNVRAAHADTEIDGSAMTTSSFTMSGLVSLNNLTSSSASFSVANISSGTIPSFSVTGTGTNDNAPTGRIGEFVSLNAGPTTLGLSTNYATITSINLSSGDWDVDGAVVFRAGFVTSTIYGGPNVAYIGTSSSGSDATVAVNQNYAEGVATAWSFGTSVPRQRFSINSTTTIYLLGLANYTGSAPQAWGSLSARRVR